MPEPEFIESIRPGMMQPVTSTLVAERRNGQIRLRSDTEGASIGYRHLEATETPGSTWQVYTEPVNLEPGERQVTVAHRLGYKPSEDVIVDRLSLPN